MEFSSVAPKVTPSGDTLAKVQAEKIPQNLNRPLKVGVYTGVKELYLQKDGETIQITVKGKELKFQGKDKAFTAVSKDIDDGKCVSIAPTKKQLTTSCYPGFFTLSYSNGKINAINTVDMEDYLRGVIPYEIGQLDSSRFEALKAQAVAARTYAYKHYNSRESLGFDVFADTKDQVYKGLQSATALTDSAVKQTRGEVMMYNGEFITAYYHSTCGGVSETLDTWEKPNLPYLKSKPDLRPDGTPWCRESSYSKWERSFESDELIKLFVQNAKDSKAKISPFKKVKDIVVKDLLKSGRILTLTVTTDVENFEVRGDKVRWLFRKDGTILPSSFFTVKKDGTKWILEGKGFGHGVGMCQMGVRARAQAGQSYIEILSHYYPGITLERFER
ncbi:MAG: SpoIID/LytB domain-containing protein [Fibrobacter sp.]|nr:SpoIID/LytB domain-containing protein [Fibrobacter sp.]